MSHTRLTLGDAARERILAGATALADAVRVTLGPKSKSIVVERKWGALLVCDDGVTIARAVDSPDARSRARMCSPPPRTSRQVPFGRRSHPAGGGCLALRPGRDAACQ